MSEWKETEIGLIPQSWKIEKISNCPIEIGDGNYSSKYPKASELVDEGIPFISSTNLNGLRIKDEKLRYISPELHQTLKKGHIQENDVLIVVRGNGVGDIALVGKDYHGANINAQLAFLRSEEIDPKFLYYLLSSQTYKKYIDCFSSGSAQPQLTVRQLSDIKIIIPPKKTQEEIGILLYSLDCKIENLRRQNETLEKIAQTLFKHWFIDFEFPNANGKPYKSSGGVMVPSELGDIPKGWRVGKLEEVGKIVCGKTPSKSEKNFYGKEIPFIKIPDMHGKIFVVDTNDWLSVDGSSSQINKLLPPYSINVSCIATVGLVTINVLPSHTNQQINSIVLNNNSFLEFLYFQCCDLSKKLNLIGSGGTATLNVSTGIFSKLDLLIPLDFIVLKYHEISKKLFEKILLNATQIQTLTKIRDSLLPKLMSGQIRVEE